MQRAFARVRGLGFILWQARHMAYHVMIALVWSWFLRERWGQFNPFWIATSVVGSLIPDADHLNYFLGYGRKDTYSRQVFAFIKNRQWRALFQFLATGHKTNTSLMYHNVYVVVIFILLALIAMMVDWQFGVVLFGAIVSHYLFDMADDVVQLGGINPNWRRWGNGRKK